MYKHFILCILQQLDNFKVLYVQVDIYILDNKVRQTWAPAQNLP